MLNKKIESVLNEQVEKEAYSSSLYLAMASWAEVKGMTGVASWLYVQSDEERVHMLKLVKYINERGGQAVIPALKQPKPDYPSVQELFKEVLVHEQFISASINGLVETCMAEKDITTGHWLQWFVNEQIEEEANATKILDKLNLLGANSLYLFDRDIVSMRKSASESEKAETT